MHDCLSKVTNGAARTYHVVAYPITRFAALTKSAISKKVDSIRQASLACKEGTNACCTAAYKSCIAGVETCVTGAKDCAFSVQLSAQNTAERVKKALGYLDRGTLDLVSTVKDIQQGIREKNNKLICQGLSKLMRAALVSVTTASFLIKTTDSWESDLLPLTTEEEVFLALTGSLINTALETADLSREYKLLHKIKENTSEQVANFFRGEYALEAQGNPSIYDRTFPASLTGPLSTLNPTSQEALREKLLAFLKPRAYFRITTVSLAVIELLLASAETVEETSGKIGEEASSKLEIASTILPGVILLLQGVRSYVFLRSSVTLKQNIRNTFSDIEGFTNDPSPFAGIEVVTTPRSPRFQQISTDDSTTNSSDTEIPSPKENDMA